MTSIDWIEGDRIKSGRLYLLSKFLEENITVIDAGARGGLKAYDASADYYKSIVQIGERLNYIGFEPDQVECDALNAEYAAHKASFQFVPLGLSDEPADMTMRFLADQPASGTTREMDLSEAEKLTVELPSLELATREASFVRLDDWLVENAAGPVDLYKLDIEGSEPNAIRGSAKTLEDVRVVLCEVGFNDAQPSHFNQVDSLLREQEFTLWRLGNMIHHRLFSDCYRSKNRVEVNFYNADIIEHPDPGGMLFQAYGYWVKNDLIHHEPESVQRAIRDAILVEACGFSDLAGNILAKRGDLPFDLDKVYAKVEERSKTLV
ncbi:MAG: FkbM family methyltransferase [Planctomycetota bacterium]